MVIENIQKSDVQTIGDVQRIKASIDVENIDFIATILSSNLYSNPMESFLREIVSNAWDAHVEADNTKEPVIVRLTNSNISVRDYGTGLTKEEFEDIYCKIGTSTKRGSNAYIGAFGIGKFASLAVSDVVYIHSYYNGKESSYVMVKENGTITTNYLGESDTTEHNGLLITVPINSWDVSKVKSALDYLVFFPNIYVDYSMDISDEYNLNKAKVVRYKNFSVASNLRKYINSSYRERIWVLLGNVLYPLEEGRLTYQFTDKELRGLKNCNICLNVNIGEINVTPNRESIIYSEQTIDILSKRMADAIIEIEELASKLTKIDCKTLPDYHMNINKPAYWHPLTNTIKEERVEGWKCDIDVTLNGQKKSETYNKAVNIFCDRDVPGFNRIIQGETLYTTKGCPWILRNLCKTKASQFIAFEDNRNISGYAKKLVLENDRFLRTPFIYIYSKERFIDDLIEHSPFSQIDKSKIDPEAIEVASELYDWVKAHTTVIKTKEIEDYKADIKATLPKESRKVDNSLYSIHKFECDCNIPRDYKLTDEPVKFPYIIYILQKTGKAVLHNGKTVTAEQFNDYKTLQYLGYTILWCSNGLYCKLIKYLANKPNSKHLNNIIINYKPILENPNKTSECKIVLGRFFRQTFTEMYNTYYVKDTIREILKYLPIDSDTENIFREGLLHYYEGTKLASSEYFKDYKVKTPYAKWLEKLLNSLYTPALKYQEFKEKLECLGINRGMAKESLAVYLMYRWCFKNRILLNLESYKTLKTDSLIKLIYEQTN